MKYIYLIASAIFICSACKKEIAETPVFNVEAEGLTYHVNDTVRFRMSGNAGNITFYSGEAGSRYAGRDSVTVEVGIPRLQFVSATVGGAAQPESFKVLLTTDSLTDEPGSITAAEWQDVTSRAKLATTSTSTNSGNIDLSDMIDGDKPVRLAFKYDAFATSTTAQPVWAIRSLTFNTVFEDGSTTPVATLSNGQWSVYDIMNSSATWTVASAQLRIQGGAANSAPSEDWVVSKPLYLNAVRKSADWGVSIQDIGSDQVETFEHIYDKPGTYRVTFVGFNHAMNTTKSVIREFDIIIQP